jgi:hypothetical protein
MIKKIWNWIKNIFKPQRQEVDEHEELYLHVPEPDTPVYENEEAVKKEHCDRHLRFIKRCPDCIEVIK